MDWSIPQTLYPTALPAIVVWLLFTFACVGTVVGIRIVARHKGGTVGFLLAIPLAVGALLATMTIGAVIAFFSHQG